MVVGAGFGGLAAAKGLAGSDLQVTLVDRHNYHLFQPLLYQVATAALSPADIATPVRSIFADRDNVRVLLGEVTGIDPHRRLVQLADDQVPYDYLVLATGARHSYFGHEEWAGQAPGLKDLTDALAIRERILLAFERAERVEDPEERRALLTFAVIGGGPTGVELAGAIAELAKRALARDFRTIDPRATRILLIEAAPKILATFPETLAQRALRALESLGVEVRLGSPVTAIDACGVTTASGLIPARTVVWAAGVTASAAAGWLDAAADRAQRIRVNADLSVPGHPEIFAIGDTALVTGTDGKPVPGVAPAAKQQGQYVARLIKARAAGRAEPPPFAYRNQGNLATIGRNRAIADFGRLRFDGFLGWLLWSLVHVLFLIGFRNKLLVTTQWLWAYLTFQRGARLITHADPGARSEEAARNHGQDRRPATTPRDRGNGRLVEKDPVIHDLSA